MSDHPNGIAKEAVGTLNRLISFKTKEECMAFASELWERQQDDVARRGKDLTHADDPTLDSPPEPLETASRASSARQISLAELTEMIRDGRVKPEDVKLVNKSSDSQLADGADARGTRPARK